MTSRKPREIVKTPQYRTALIRAMKNLEPDFRVEFIETERGIAFKMKDSQGRDRSETINFYTDHGDVLHKKNLRRALDKAGFPGVFN